MTSNFIVNQILRSFGVIFFSAEIFIFKHIDVWWWQSYVSLISSFRFTNIPDFTVRRKKITQSSETKKGPDLMHKNV